MSSRLSSEEFDAIQAAIGRGKRPPAGADAALEDSASPIPLIADDRAAERARPSTQKICQRWGAAIPTLLQRLCRVDVDATVQSVEVIDGGGLREPLGQAWIRCLRVEKRSDMALISVAGPMVEVLSACLLGARIDDTELERPPTAVARQLFGRVGQALARGLTDAWFEEQDCKVTLLDDAEHAELWRRSLHEGDLVVSATLAIEGEARGTVGLVARPETLVVPPAPVGAVPAPPGAIENALGAVPVEVSVELGRVTMTMTDLARLRPGALLPLDKFLEDPLPIRVAGKDKAQGRALIARGSLAVEVTGTTQTKGRPS